MIKKFFILSLSVLAITLFLSTPISAQTSIINTSDSNYAQGNYDVDDILSIAIKTSRIVLGIIGSLALLMFIYGGLSFLISGGSSEKVSKAKGIIAAAAIGLIIVFASFLIIKFVLKALGRDDFDGKKMNPTPVAEQLKNLL